MLNRIFLARAFVKFSLVFIGFYHACVDNLFFNIACEDTKGIEKVADLFLVPYQYAFTGRRVMQREDKSWHFEPRFDYSDHFWMKNVPSWGFASTSFVIGGTIKTLASLCSSEMRERYKGLAKPQPVHLKNDLYREMGLFQKGSISDEPFISQKMPRRPGDERHLEKGKGVLGEIGAALTQAGILWWVDCGTCLGVYRHEGVIPWDYDIDIAILEPDFENVYQLLKELNPQKYMVFDQSSRDHPMSLLKVILREHPENEIDIYHFHIDPKARTLTFILSQENHIFLPQSWKIRERPFKIPAKFEDVFPLKRALFDGIEVFIPNDIQRYLRRVYGENLAPAKKYNPRTGNYEKELSHPYWQRPFAH